MSNRHIVDQLADVRQEIKRLQYEEVYLKEQVERHGDDLQGDEYEARLYRKSSSRLDRKLVEAKFGRKNLDGCFKSSEFTTIELRRRINRPETTLQDEMQDENPF